MITQTLIGQKRRIIQLCLITSFIVLGLLVSSANALLRDLSKEDLITNAERIVYGKVITVRCAWSDNQKWINTYVTLQVKDQFKGQSVGRELTLQIPGGTIGDATQVFEDAPDLRVGMEILIHTFTQVNGEIWIYGWQKGVLTVENGRIPEYNMSLDQFREYVNNLVK